ncbi:3-deoxy-manno-octulosonate cytidylyltransferase [Pseudoalteromonas sp. NSLLW24]|uniref:3-deoxy-manno-octulosonate cytidylyltransferase n=1 Tax=Pseudoalteromonas sp. NSLLW24 TaxID=2792050 RepID=UPI0018CE8EEC|nr:3-deoxy-manno-octulosonate cytidylyltransferase [Pseudoalteromonas sp. NSLLW24]MBG9999208.1 3-deoxy-manno-octulosonate cytidylyltransferase [Pseudoalteromonas sp. NSLLW24]
MLKNGIKVVIPARYGSSRLPAKPLLELNNKPLFWHVTQRVLEANVSIEDIVIATDDLRIEKKAKELKLPVVMTSINNSSGTDRVNEVVNILGWSANSYVINVQGDEPLIPPELIRKLIKFTTLNDKFDITTVVTPIKSYEDFIDLNVVKAIVTEQNQALYFSRSPAPLNRDEPTDFSKAKHHIGIYIYKVSALQKFCSLPESLLEQLEKLEQLRAISNQLTIGVMNFNGEVHHGIDTEKDYLKIKELME